MNYPDLEKRIQELVKIEAIFNKRAFFETESKIYALFHIIQEPITNTDLMIQYQELLMVFGKEFSNRFTYGQTYRRKCFREISNLVFDVIASITPVRFRKYILELEPVLVSLTQSKKTIDEISQAIKMVNEEARFHLLCYSYLIIVEGIFDELARILFSFSSLKKGKYKTINKLQKIEVNDIFQSMEPNLIIFKDWKEKKHIRNAIAHATVNYNLTKNEITFVDNYADSTFTKTYSFQDFVVILTELESASEVFILFMLLLKVKDILFAEKAFD